MLKTGRVKHLFFTVTELSTNYSWENSWLQDEPIIDNFSEFQEAYKEFYRFHMSSSISMYDSPDPSDEWAPYQGLYMASFGQDPVLKILIYNKASATDLLAKIGGLSITLIYGL